MRKIYVQIKKYKLKIFTIKEKNSLWKKKKFKLKIFTIKEMNSLWIA